ncbi:SRPBCC domain-containing protein [Tabrizicola sp. BL-A-41-H6]|uniref:SRPBCC domain-containing protein n=1 Tax=Tabrizicola sp. BL-A-41-H6 TaxID=3421107 RepID=UPI003D669123
MTTTFVTDGETDIVVTRRFAAPPAAVFRAHTEPDLIRRWMLGPEGWSMPVCISDARPGGAIRFEWSDGRHVSFYATGEYIEVTPHSRIVHIERMFLPEPTPDNHVTTTFEPVGTGTRLVMRMSLPNAEARAAVLASGMQDGMEDSYARLEQVIEAGI